MGAGSQAERPALAIYAAAFVLLTAVWCWLGFKLVNNAAFGASLQRWGHVVLPVVLIALGIHILVSAH